MTFALIEVEALAKKAARGAGYDWGMTEEAAKATRWLCAAGIDGVAALVAVLARADGLNSTDMAPRSLGGDWEARSGSMCPLMAGATLSDSAIYWAETGKRIAKVVSPIMLVPFVACAARQLGTVVTMQANNTRAVTDGFTVSIEPEQNEIALFTTIINVSIQTGGQLFHPRQPHNRADPTQADWAKLNQFACRTYAPDTEASRLKGAGAGVTDND